MLYAFRHLPVWKKVMLIVWLLIWPLFLALHLYPIRSGSLRLGLVLGIFLIWTGALLLFWNKKPIRGLCLLIAFIFMLGCLWPKRADNLQALRQEYVLSLLAYKGAPYVWGGENKWGIDCSGLMRCALIDSEVKQGITTLNPALLREGFSLWWNDCSALELKDGFQNRTRLLFIAHSLNQINYSKIEPGDIAVTSSGVHVLAYIGHKSWIEADPNEIAGHQVIEVQVPARSAWFNMPVHVMRWRQLEAGL